MNSIRQHPIFKCVSLLHDEAETWQNGKKHKQTLTVEQTLEIPSFRNPLETSLKLVIYGNHREPYQFRR